MKAHCATRATLRDKGYKRARHSDAMRARKVAKKELERRKPTDERRERGIRLVPDF